MSPRLGRSAGTASGTDREPAGEPDVLEAALASALAAAAGVEPGTVRVRVDGVRAAELGGAVELHLALDLGTGPVARDVESEEGTEVRDEAEDVAEDGVEDGADPAPVDPVDLEAQADAAADFLEGLLDAFDLDGDLQLRVADGVAEVEIADAGDGVLIGRRGQTLEAIQELTRSALQRRFQQRVDVVVDVDGYRARRVERLLERTDEAIEDVKRTGEPERLEPMDAFERKVVHQRVAEAGGLVSNSFGRDPGRRVIIERA